MRDVKYTVGGCVGVGGVQLDDLQHDVLLWYMHKHQRTLSGYLSSHSNVKL